MPAVKKVPTVKIPPNIKCSTAKFSGIPGRSVRKGECSDMMLISTRSRNKKEVNKTPTHPLRPKENAVRVDRSNLIQLLSLGVYAELVTWQTEKQRKSDEITSFQCVNRQYIMHCQPTRIIQIWGCTHLFAFSLFHGYPAVCSLFPYRMFNLTFFRVFPAVFSPFPLRHFCLELFFAFILLLVCFRASFYFSFIVFSLLYLAFSLQF